MTLSVVLSLGAAAVVAQTPSAGAKQNQLRPLTQQQNDLFTYVTRDNEGAVRRLLEDGVEPNVLNDKGQSPLTLALQLGSLNAFNGLMSSEKTNVEFRNARDESPLMLAAIRGNADAVTRLMRQGAHVNKTHWTPLHYAASGEGDTQVVIARLLLEHNAYIDAQSPNNTTPLMMAAQYGTNDVVKLLMQEGADPTMKNQLGLTAVDFAQRAGRDTLAQQIAQYAQKIQQQRSQPKPSKAAQ
ncbi:ankyrin repeat domain-containing protein [Lampropedia puyangensis]|uniref:ankyrin repeat domain-containing protein n=1 Tax=Lampropedia puyangensis TaxID=1330072 RepID=UPI001FCE400D|nr:ankyrin repeat domain-containing protein [Lampropedia puyangensis]